MNVYLGLEARVRRQLSWLAVLLAFGSTAVVSAQSLGTDLLAVSKPPASLLPTDPPQGLVYRVSPDLGSAEVFFDAEGGPMDLVYLVLGTNGDGYLTFEGGPDEAAPGGVMIVEALRSRGSLTFDAARDRLITGRSAGLAEPKDLVLIEDLGFVIVADFAGADIKVFDTLTTGDVPPLFTIDRLGTGVLGERRPWGLAYDDVSDRLFVGATDGALLVYDTFLASQGENGPSRVVTPTWQGEPVSHNLHELVYDRDADQVIVTDVGAATTSDQPGFDSDGAILVLEEASRIHGPTPVSLRLAGPNTMLGNPVSLVRQGNSIFVAENSLELLLRFDGLLGRRGVVDAPPDAAISLVKPESIILLPR